MRCWSHAVLVPCGVGPMLCWSQDPQEGADTSSVTRHGLVVLLCARQIGGRAGPGCAQLALERAEACPHRQTCTGTQHMCAH